MSDQPIRGFNLSFLQKRVWLLQAHTTGLYQLATVEIEGKLNPSRLEESIRQVVATHDSLRTTYYTKPEIRFPLQVVAEQPAYRFDYLTDPAATAESIVDASPTHFQVETEPPLHAKLVRLSEVRHLLTIACPAIACDAFSLQRIIREIAQCYENPASLQSDEIIQYPQFSQWQQDLVANPEPEALDFWEKYLSSDHKELVWPFEEKRTSAEDVSPGETSPGIIRVTLPAEVVGRLRPWAQRQATDVSRLCLACLYVLAHKHTGDTLLTLGYVHNERAYEELQSTIGLVAKVLPTTVQLNPEGPVEALLGQINEVLEAIRSWEEYYFRGYAVADTGTDGSDVPTFSLGFEWMDLSQPLPYSDSLTFRFKAFRSNPDVFKLRLSGVEYENEVQLQFCYQTDVFEKPAVALLTEQFVRLLQDLPANATQPIAQLSALSYTDVVKITREFNVGIAAHSTDNTLIDRFENQARQTPEQTAVVFGEKSLTYAELDRQANQLATWLIEQHQVKPGDRVVVCLPRTEKMVVSLLAVLKTGAAYLPLDQQLPAERLQFITEDSQARLVIVDQAADPEPAGVTCLELTIAWEAIRQQSDEKPPVSFAPESAVYVIYTSGSTGQPKGVEISHRSLVNYLSWFTSSYPLSGQDRTLLFSSLAFDLGYTSFWSSLVAGCTVYMLEEQSHLDPKSFTEALIRHRITYIKLTPSHFSLIVHAPDFEKQAALYSLRLIVLGGEEIKVNEVAWYWQYAPEVQFVNHYGPTETTIGTIATRIDKETFGSFAARPVIGKPITHNQVFILRQDASLAAVGEVGEIGVSGRGLAIGYLNRPELTREKFIDHPLLPGQRLYRTGDLGRWLLNGDIQFLGRKDFQVKIRGFRVELGEIEAILLKHPGVRQAVVVAKTDQTASNYLVAYFTPAEGEVNDLGQYLGQCLPEYMIPAYFVSLPTLPYTANGKINRKALPDHQSLVQASEYVAPRNSIEAQMVAIWEEVLDRKKISIRDNFFKIGGHSLKAIQIVSRIYKEMRAKIEFRSLFEAPTIESLVQVITASTSAADPYETIQPVPEAAYYEASHGQKRLWVLQQLDGGAAYNTLYSYVLNGELNEKAFVNALESLVARHEILRTVFTVVEGDPKQKVCAVGELAFMQRVDLQHQPDREERAQRLAREEAVFRFDLEKGPLFRTTLVTLEQNKHLFFIHIHHVISDGWSLRVVVNEVLSLYEAYTQEQPSPFVPLRIQYKDYSHWQYEQLSGEPAKVHQAYWWQQLAGPLPVLDLPTYRPRPAVQTSRGKTVRFSLDEDIRNRLVVLSQEQGCSLFMTLLAALNVLFYKYTNQQDILLGTSVAGRSHQDLENQIGLYLNTLVLRTRLEAEKSFLQLLEHVKETVLMAFEHQVYPFDRLVEELPLQRDLSRSPLFDVLVEMQNYEHSVSQTEGVEGLARIDVQPYEVETETSIVDLNLMFVDAVSSLQLHVRYNTDIFTDEQITQLSRHFEHLLRQLVAQPAKPIAAFGLLTSADRQWLDALNQTKSVFPQQPAFRIFEENARQLADQPALQCGHTILTYRQLNENANQLAHFLRRHHRLSADELVAIVMDRSDKMLESILAVWKCGGAYVPIDPAYPEERIRLVVGSSRARLVVTRSGALSSRLESELALQKKVLNLDVCSQPISEAATHNLNLPVGLNDLAYVIYTSGSTGTPKGAMVEHVGMTNHLYAKVNDLRLTGADRIVQNASACFDISVWQAWAALMVGGKTTMYDNGLVMNPDQLAVQVEKDGVTVLEVVPSYLSVLLDHLEKQQPATLYGRLRYLVVTGEAVKPGLIRRWFDRFPHVPVVNAYGPTEASDDITHHFMEKAPESTTVPVGKTVQNLKIYVTDEGMSLLPVGIQGEICVSGVGVGRGYLYDQEKTQAAFGEDPFRSQPGVRLYKTGDLGRYLPDGSLEFLGRKDSQVKIRGYRIETGEIEHALTRVAGVKEAVVVAVETPPADHFLCAYLTFDDGKSTEIELIKKELAKALPAYMIPSGWMVLPALPLNANGKIDRKALPPPAPSHNREEATLAPRTRLEEQLKEIWEEVLQKSGIGIRDSFFEIGGHSLRAIRVIALLDKKLGLKMDLRDLFTHPTIEKMAERLESAETSAYEEIVPLPEQPDYEVSHAQRRLWVMDQFEVQRTAYYVPAAYVLEGPMNWIAFEKAFQTLLQRHESLRTTIGVVDGQPRQKIHSLESCGFRITYLDFRQDADGEAKARNLAQAEATDVFDLAAGPLVRAKLIHLADERYLFLFTLHHIISDGWSEAVLVNEVLALYRAYLKGQPNPLAPLRIQYKDFVAWQNRQLSGERLTAHRTYWLEQFAGKLQPLALPTDFSRPEVKTSEASKLFFTLPPAVKQGLQQISQGQNATVFMALLAALKVVLHKYTAQDDIIVGTPAAGRSHADLSNQIGLFLNILALRTHIRTEESFNDLLRKVRETTVGAYAHQEYPFDRLVEDLNLPRDISRSSLFDVGFTWQNLEDVENEGSVDTFEDLTVSFYDNGLGRVKTDFWFHGWDAGEKIAFSITYNKDLYRQSTIERLINDFQELVSRLVNEPRASIQSLVDALVARERKEERMNQTKNKEKNLEKFFNTKAKKLPANERALVTESYLDSHPSYPLVIQPNVTNLVLTEWIKANQREISEKLIQTGGILFRGFDAMTAESAQTFAQILSEQRMSYMDQSSPRSLVADKLYTSTDHPADQVINMHNELSYSYSWPMQIMFFCLQAAETGGETPIADSRRTLSHLSEATQAKFRAKGIRYVRNLIEGMGLSWQEVYQTTDKTQVEAYCQKNDVQFEWKGEKHLRISWTRPAIHQHPLTGEWLWFNHGFFFNAHHLDPVIHALAGSKEMLPFNTYYGDGSAIESSVIEEIREAFERSKHAFAWQKGDILLLDNMLMAHGRNPFTGSRKVLVAMNNAYCPYEAIENEAVPGTALAY